MKFRLLTLVFIIALFSACSKKDAITKRLEGTWRKTSITVSFYGPNPGNFIQDTTTNLENTPNHNAYYALYKANSDYEYYVLQGSNKIFSVTGKYSYSENSGDYKETLTGAYKYGAGNPYRDDYYPGLEPAGKLIFDDDNHLSIVYRYDDTYHPGNYQTTTLKFVKQ